MTSGIKNAIEKLRDRTGDKNADFPYKYTKDEDGNLYKVYYIPFKFKDEKGQMCEQHVIFNYDPFSGEEIKKKHE
jgi:hypothetical protein